MKIRKVMINSVLFAGVLIINLNTDKYVQAETTYTDSLNATASGKVTFEESDDDMVPSPMDPNKPVDPGELNKNPGDLKLVYASPFDFGTHKRSIYGLEALSTGVSVKDLTENTDIQVMPFVTTKDMRVTRGNGWELTAKASSFTDGTHTIKGATISLLEANYADGDVNNKLNKPTVVSNNIELEPETTVRISKADTSENENQGIGMYSLALGTSIDDNNLATGVKFTLPTNTIVNTTSYKAKIVWTLAPKV